jgi:Fe-S cluster assembly ATP-binding protein
VNARIKAEAAARNGGVLPPEVKGVSIPDFRKQLRAAMKILKVDDSFAGRYLNDGFSGGEKKRAEVLQMAMLKPQLAVLDETDSGLDIDALRVVSEGVNALHDTDPNMGVLVITHYQRLLNYIKPQFVHVLMDGQMVENGGPELALHLEERGYDWLREPEVA